MPRTLKMFPRSRTTTIQNLIDALEDAREAYGADAPVVFASDYGDIVHTQQVHLLDGDVDESIVEESAYSGSGWAVSEDEDGSETQTVLVLS